MDELNGLIYGLEFQARALTPQLAENNEIRFFIATNSLKPTNQVHLVEYNEEKSAITSKIFEHSLGEVWNLSSSPHDARLVASCYSVQKLATVQTQAALLTLPDNLEEPPIITSEFLSWANIEQLDTEAYGDRVKTVEFHPYQKDTLASVIDNRIVVFSRTESSTRPVTEVIGGNGGGASAGSSAISNTKNSINFSTGKWSHHHQGNQFVALHDNCVRSYDIRDPQRFAWAIEDAHGQFVRDIDCNPNKQCHFVTGGDDGYIKIWDSRMPKEPVFARNDHAHWVWAVRFNTFHDQLILSSSSDCKVLLSCASSVSSEAAASPDILGDEKETGNQSLNTESRRPIIPDGLLQTFDQHEDSVYCVEWSNVDPWIFASLSYDGRLLISKVPKQFKYQIII